MNDIVKEAIIRDYFQPKYVVVIDYGWEDKCRDRIKDYPADFRNAFETFLSTHGVIGATDFSANLFGMSPALIRDQDPVLCRHRARRSHDYLDEVARFTFQYNEPEPVLIKVFQVVQDSPISRKWCEEGDFSEEEKRVIREVKKHYYEDKRPFDKLFAELLKYIIYPEKYKQATKFTLPFYWMDPLAGIFTPIGETMKRITCQERYTVYYTGLVGGKVNILSPTIKTNYVNIVKSTLIPYEDHLSLDGVDIDAVYRGSAPKPYKTASIREHININEVLEKISTEAKAFNKYSDAIDAIGRINSKNPAYETISYAISKDDRKMRINWEFIEDDEIQSVELVLEEGETTKLCDENAFFFISLALNKESILDDLCIEVRVIEDIVTGSHSIQYSIDI